MVGYCVRRAAQPRGHDRHFKRILMDHTIAKQDVVFIDIGSRHGRYARESRFPVDGAIDEKSGCLALRLIRAHPMVIIR
jgi:hypothetical protein